MKKTGILLLSFFLLCLFGCSAKKPPAPCLDFTASVIISQRDSLSERNTYQAQLTSKAQGVVVLRLQSDDVLNNLQYKWDEKLTVSYGELSFETPVDYLPSFSFAQGIYNVLFDLPRNGEFKGFEEDLALFSGTAQSGEYVVKTDKEGTIQQISVEEINLLAEFSYDVGMDTIHL